MNERYQELKSNINNVTISYQALSTCLTSLERFGLATFFPSSDSEEEFDIELDIQFLMEEIATDIIAQGKKLQRIFATMIKEMHKKREILNEHLKNCRDSSRNTGDDGENL